MAVSRTLADRILMYDREVERRKSAADDRARRQRERKGRRQAKATARRKAGKTVNVSGYCRRGKRSNEQVNREMPF